MDYQSTLYDPIYDAIGLAATIDPSSSAPGISITIVNKTGRYQVPGEVTIESVRQVLAVRMVELTANGIDRGDLNQAQVTVGGQTFVIEATQPMPSPNGEADGELYLLLRDP